MTVPVHGLPPVVREGLVVTLVPPALKGPRSRRVTRADVGRGEGQLVKLEGIDGLEQSSKLVGHTLLARVEDLPSDIELRDAEGIIGREVMDELHGSLGTIAEVMRGPANDVWVVEGDLGEVMVPAVQEFVLGTSEDGGIRVRVPEGLIGLEENDEV